MQLLGPINKNKICSQENEVQSGYVTCQRLQSENLLSELIKVSVNYTQ